MKIKTSITLSEDLMKEIEELLGKSGNRSELIEKALRVYLKTHTQQIRNTKDLEILNQHTKRLNREAEDVLSYQVKL